MSYGTIYILSKTTPTNPRTYVISWKGAYEIPYTKYSIKETDFRVKTASFTSPKFYDLTRGLYLILISSKYHENFGGYLLDVEYDEDTGLYTYQCQDWSRMYMGKFEQIYHNVNFYKLLRHQITHGWLPLNPTKEQKQQVKHNISGLRALDKYNQSYYKGNIYKGNPFNRTVSILTRDKSKMEVIRGMVFNSLGYFDVWFNDRGILQIEPISKTDWENTGLVLSAGGYYGRKFKFSTTNAITGVIVNGNELNLGSSITSKQATGLDLSAVFGDIKTSINNPNQSNAVTTSSSSSKKSKKATKSDSSKNKYNNPYMNKPKKVWVNADDGSNKMKKELCKKLGKDGWKVHEGITDSNAHYNDYFKVHENWVYVTIYNGVCAGTLREAYSSKIQNILKKKNVQLVVVFDTATWDDPKRNLKSAKYGNFKNKRIKRAWDDNFSSKNPAIGDMEKFFKKNKAKYCASPTASEVMKQFNAGGYFAYKGIKV